MARSIWKGPFVHPSLLKKVDNLIIVGAMAINFFLYKNLEK